MRLYYVAFLLDAGKNIVIPCTWMRNAEKIVEKFVNYGLNTNQTHLCFWSIHADAKTQDGKPNFDYQPNFDSQIKTEFPCDEGVFRCRVVKFTSEYLFIILSNDIRHKLKFFLAAEYEVALTFADERRERVPALYKEQRLYEQPLPNLEQPLDVEMENRIAGNYIF